MIGIYRIRNIINGKCYYGSSKEIEKRIRRHKRELKNNIHVNCILQRAWNKYGEHSFLFEIVEECNVDVLLEIEQKYLDLRPEYNIGIKSSGGDNLTKNPNKDKIIKKITKSVKKTYDLMPNSEKKEKHSRPMQTNPNWKGGKSYIYCECGKRIDYYSKKCLKCADKSGKNNPFYGKKHSEKTKKRLSEKRMGKKPTNMKQVVIGNIIYESLADASRQIGIPSPTILWRINSKNDKFADYKYV